MAAGFQDRSSNCVKPNDIGVCTTVHQVRRPKWCRRFQMPFLARDSDMGRLEELDKNTCKRLDLLVYLSLWHRVHTHPKLVQSRWH